MMRRPGSSRDLRNKSIVHPSVNQCSGVWDLLLASTKLNLAGKILLRGTGRPLTPIIA